MKKNKSIIYAVVGAVVVLGGVASQYIDWPVDSDNAGGDIAKSSHFSRKTSDANVGNMQDLLKNDEEYKNGIVAAYTIMEVAGKDLDSVLGGEEVSDLEQNTSNAVVAYNTLQKQNNLADRFIEVVDKVQGASLRSSSLAEACGLKNSLNKHIDVNQVNKLNPIIMNSLNSAAE